MAQRVRARLARAVEAAGGAAVRAWSRARLPRDRALRVPGLSLETLVRFDRHGVPHVRAATEADAFRGLGVCHGRDRFFQMDMTRRVLAGRLTEVVGERPLGSREVPPLSGGTTLDADRLFRVLDLVRAARATLAAATPDERALLDAYTAGVNAAVARLRRRPPPEWKLLSLAIEDWTPLDSCLVAKGMALGLSFKWRTGPVYAALADALADRPDHLRSILPRGPGPASPTIARLAPARGSLSAALAFVGWEAPLAGSNAFVVGGGRTASGLPLLANDPHLELSLPGVWYLASASGGGYAAVGATLPGLPGVVIGRTRTVAWGFTNAMLDDADLWIEEIDGTGTRYRVDGAWRDLEVETQEIRRRGKGPVLFRLRRTHRGPVLSDAFPGYDGRALSIRAVYLESNRDLQTFLALGRARDAADVERATEGYGSPAQNLVYATTEGIAGYRMMGRVPRRPPGEPALPRDGTTGASDWLGDVPREELPAFRLRSDEACVTANDPQVGPSYPHYLSNLYEPSYRAERIRARLAGRSGLAAADFAAVQMDTTSLQAAAFRRAVLLPNADAVRAARPAAAAGLDRLLGWDGSEHAGSPAAALYHFVYYHLARRAFSPALGEPLVRRWMSLVNLMDAPLLAAFSEPDDPWVKPDVRPTLLGQAIEDAVAELASRGLPIDARWGEVHALTLRHPMSAAPVLGAAWTRGPFPMPGGPYTPLAGQYFHHRPAEMVVGASYRHVVDLVDPEGRSWMSTFGGQSGHVGSRHYDDLTAPWARGEFLPMRLDRVPEEGSDLRLLPA